MGLALRPRTTKAQSEPTLTRPSAVVEPEVPNLNLMRRLDRLDSAWIQGSTTIEALPPFVFDEGFDVIENPSKRSRTPFD